MTWVETGPCRPNVPCMDAAVQPSILATTVGPTSTRANRVSPDDAGLEAAVTSLLVGPADGRVQPARGRDSNASRPTPRRRSVKGAMAAENATPKGSGLKALTRQTVGNHAQDS